MGTTRIGAPKAHSWGVHGACSVYAKGPFSRIPRGVGAVKGTGQQGGCIIGLGVGVTGAGRSTSILRQRHS